MNSVSGDEPRLAAPRMHCVAVLIGFGGSEIITNPRQDHPTTFVRSLGSMERLFYRYSERNPAHFAIVAEFDDVLTAERVRPALGVVQRRHPLLSAHVEDRPGTRLGFYRASTLAPIGLSVHRSPESAWDALAADELSRPFDRSHAPLMRASLLQRPHGSVLLLVFDHTIADGISSVLVLNDILAVLNGETLSTLAVPQSQEHMITRALREIEPTDTAQLPDDPRMRTPSAIRPFDGALTNLRTMAMSQSDTARLAQRCRAERTTVHAAMVVAMCRVRATERGEDFVRVLNPINFRPLIGADGDCGLYIQSTWTGLSPWDGAPFWEQARATTAHLEVARSAPGIVAAARAVQQVMTPDAETADAEELFSRICPFDLLVTNLGVQNLDGASPLRPTAVWGPVVQSQTEGEYVTGVTTY